MNKLLVDTIALLLDACVFHEPAQALLGRPLNREEQLQNWMQKVSKALERR